ncbi:hypothetical protein D3C72_1069790 [compost metagenome]
MATLFLACAADRVEQRVVVADAARGPHHRTTGPIGAERTRRDSGHVDAERRDFLAQHLADAFQRELAAAVPGDARQGDEAAHGGDVEDVAAAARAHVRQHGLDQRGRTEHVHFELMAQFVQRGFFEDAFVAVAGVVDQHVDGADVGFHAGHQCIDGGGIGDVQQAAEGATRREGFEILTGGFAAHGADHAMAGQQRLLGQGAAEAAADAGDEEEAGYGHGQGLVAGVLHGSG